MGREIRIILASGSAARRAMLGAAGVTFDIIPAQIDEAALKAAALAAAQAPRDIASELARRKAEAISALHPNALVIGADQILAFGDELLSKSDSLAAARGVLSKLRGAEHKLYSAAAIARGGKAKWSACDQAALVMRAFSDAERDAYVARAGRSILRAVGCYELEGLGVTLFDRIEGDYFTILGMPLLPLLARLREEGVLML